jgi:asparagine synthetase B (glutamine-hydrolysing)
VLTSLGESLVADAIARRGPPGSAKVIARSAAARHSRLAKAIVRSDGKVSIPDERYVALCAAGL